MTLRSTCLVKKTKNKTTDSEIPFMIQKKATLKRQKVNNWILGVRVGESVNCKWS